MTGKGPISPVNFKKWQCSLSLFKKKLSVNFKIVQYHLPILRNTLCHVGNIFLMSIDFTSLVDFGKNMCRTVKLRVKGPKDGTTPLL